VNELLVPGLWGKLMLAFACGAAIGLERELSDKPAGLRTNMLICVGSTLITMLSIYVAIEFSQHQTVIGDPSRIAGEMISGIGFLGAGAIIQARGSVHGLTTAATMWVMAGIGLAIGSGAYVAAIGTTVLLLAILFVLGRFEARFLERRKRYVHLHVVARREKGVIHRFNELADELGISLEGLQISRKDDRVEAEFALTCKPKVRDALVEGLLDHEAIENVNVSE
jgi:putative Mg2+ transporter-C (MgtC) family protein